MEKVIAIFGAGPGLGNALARRFGQEGFRVALVVRRKESLDALLTELAAARIGAAAFQADLRESDRIPGLISDIREHFGRIDVVEYAPITTAPFIAAADLTPDALEPYVRLFLYSPIAIVQAVLPEMLERGDGAILVTHGGTAARPVPGLSGVGPIMAATRNFLFALHGEVADKGVYVGTLTNSAIIRNSAYHELTRSNEASKAKFSHLPIVDPEELADLYFRMMIDRKRIEANWPPIGEDG